MLLASDFAFCLARRAVYAQVCIRDFQELSAADAAALPPGFFAAPPEYRTVSLEEKLDSMEKRMKERRASAAGSDEGGEDDGAEGDEAAAEQDGSRGSRRRRRSTPTPVEDCDAAAGAM